MPHVVRFAPALTGLLSLCASLASAANLLVPAQFPTIQAAVNASRDGDVIIIAPGSYFEQVVVDGRSLTLTAPSGTSAKVNGQAGPALTITGDGFGTRAGSAAAAPGGNRRSGRP